MEYFKNHMTMKIGSCAEANKLGNGSYVKSDSSKAGGHSWRIAFFPNGRLAGTTASMSLFLLLDDDDDNDNAKGARTATAAAADGDVVHVKFRFMMHEVYDDRSPVFMSGTVATAAFSRRSNAHGFERFVSRDDFEKTALFKRDRFAIQCRLTVFPAGSKRAARPRAPPLSGLPADLGRLLATKEGADVELEVQGKVFAAHKSVLAARSPVFMEELFGPAKEEDTSYVRIMPDMSPEAFEALLHYVYTDTLPPEMAMAMASLEEGVVLAEGLLAAADRYELKDLKLLTEQKMCNHVGVSTVLPLLALAEHYQCCKLKKMCLGFISSCGNTRLVVMATNDLEILARSSPSVIKDVITEILDAREERRRRLINFCIFAFSFILPFLLFAIFS
ncbi:hypothetical protein SORBI_3002G028201 [Sorghum bicolor]|uniref:BTB domain-containing protein n=1 Tax=Sorghum bicolor TaxID=4558 RepID=A0A1W0W1Y1_SORBI|nr:hypothetical protein SORBI_3002G028201 [Sorghum bicolor]